MDDVSVITADTNSYMPALSDPGNVLYEALLSELEAFASLAALKIQNAVRVKLLHKPELDSMEEKVCHRVACVWSGPTDSTPTTHFACGKNLEVRFAISTWNSVSLAQPTHSRAAVHPLLSLTLSVEQHVPSHGGRGRGPCPRGWLSTTG